MKLLTVAKGTLVQVHNNADQCIAEYRTEERTLKQDLAFQLEDVLIDPVGQVGCHRGHTRVIGGAWAEAGYYGFGWGDHHPRMGWTILVPMDKVVVM